MEIEREFVGLPSPVVGRAGAGGHPCQGLYHYPRVERGGPRVTTALIATHYNVDFSEHYLAEHLASRGYGFLGWNTRFRGAEPYFVLDHALAEIAVGIRWLREKGIERVVLLGNSGGGSLMSAYHSQSVEPNIRPAFRWRLLEQALNLPPADLFVFLAAHPGRPEVLTDWLDPSIVDENDVLSRDPALDMYDPDNGPPYSADFISRYRAAQKARNAKLTDWCLSRLAKLEAGGVGDQLFVTRRIWADLRFVDPAIDPSDRRTPWCYGGDPKRANDGVFGIGTVSTLRSWLNMWSLTESDCVGAGHFARLDLPTLLIQPSMDNGVFPSQAEAIFAAIAATDKQYVTMKGDHYFADAPGHRPAVADLIDEWLRSHDAAPTRSV